MAAPLASNGALKKRLYIALVERRNLSGAAAIHFTVDAEHDDYVRRGLPLEHALVIPNGLDPDEFADGAAPGAFRARWKIPPEKKLILFMSRLSPIKGLDTLLPAFAKVLRHEPAALLVLDGSADAGYREVVDRMVHEAKIDSATLVTGPFDRKDLPALVDSDVFVLPSYSESFGMAVIQALYMKLPTVVSRHVGIAPEIEQAKAGLVVDKDIDACAGAIVRILRHPEEAKAMAERGRRLVERRYLMSAVADRFIEEYRKLVNA